MVAKEDYDDSDIDALDAESDNESNVDAIEEVFPKDTGEIDEHYLDEKDEEPLILLELKQEKMGRKWQTGLCLIQIYRDLPINDKEGNKISGKILDINHRIGSDWFEKNVGGGTYHVFLRGPADNPKHRGKPILGRVSNIVIGGQAFINNKTPPDLEFVPAGQQPAARDEVVKLMGESAKRFEDLLASQNKEMAIKMDRMEEARDRARDDDKSMRENKESTMYEAMERMREKDQEVARDQASRTEGLFATILNSSKDPERDAAIRQQLDSVQEAARQRSESHSRELRDLSEVHRTQIDQVRQDFQAQLIQVRADASDRERTAMTTQSEKERLMREEFDKRERDLRDTAATREQYLRDETDRRERSLRDGADKEEKHLLQQVTELKDEVRSLRDKGESLGKEASEAKFERIKAEMVAAQSQDNPGGLMGLAKNMEEFQAVAGILGMAKGDAAPDVLSQVTAVLNTEAAKRVGTGLANVAAGLVSRGQPQQAVQQALQPTAPTPDSLAQWTAMQEQMRAAEDTGGVQRTGVRRRSGPVGPVATEAVVEISADEQAAASAQAFAEQHQTPIVDSSIPQDVLDQAMAAQQGEAVVVNPEDYGDEATSLLLLVDQAIDADKSAGELWEAVEPTLGEHVGLILAVHPDVILERLESATGGRLSIRARKLLREALAYGKEKHGKV